MVILHARQAEAPEGAAQSQLFKKFKISFWNLERLKKREFNFFQTSKSSKKHDFNFVRVKKKLKNMFFFARSKTLNVLAAELLVVNKFVFYCNQWKFGNQTLCSVKSGQFHLKLGSRKKSTMRLILPFSFRSFEMLY